MKLQAEQLGLDGAILTEKYFVWPVSRELVSHKLWIYQINPLQQCLDCPAARHCICKKRGDTNQTCSSIYLEYLF